jgi:plastocyanin
VPQSSDGTDPRRDHLSRRLRHLALYLAALVAGGVLAVGVAAVGPVDAAAPTGTITAFDNGFEDPGTGASSTTITAGGTVTFSYPGGATFHNVDFLAMEPTSCTQTAGSMMGPVPPLPAAPAPAGWSGQCRFDTPGTYAFVCEAHPFMTGEVHVVESTTTTTTTTTTPTTTTPTTTTPDGSPAPPAPPAPPKVSVPRRQRGAVVRGAVTTPAGGSRIVVTASVSNRALARRRPKRVRQVRIGTQSKRSTGAGRTRFAVRLNAAARRALRRRHRLAVRLRIVVTPAGGPAVPTTVKVLLLSAR